METKKCSECGKNMIKVDTGMVLESCPPQYPQKWWCKCGHEESGAGSRGPRTQEDEDRNKQWEAAQKG